METTGIYIAYFTIIICAIGIFVILVSRLIEKLYPNSNKVISNVIPIAISIIFFLSFHITLPNFKIFPKDNLTFSHTLITQKDIDDVIERYNSASLLDKVSIRNEPFVRKLMEKGIIYSLKDK